MMHGQTHHSPAGGDDPLKACFARTDGNPLEDAFPRKLAIHAGFGGVPVKREEMNERLEEMLSMPRTGKTAAYIHVPFCETHCLYCGFYTKAYGPEESARYTDTLLRKLALWRDTPMVRSGPVHCVYIGGGTPTSLEADDLRRLLRGIREALPLANDCEITVEGRIHNFGPDKMDTCLEAGANRFSLGVQTFDTALRRSMARKASREDVFSALRRLSGYDQAAVVIDLIYGFPDQDMDLWRKDLALLQELDLDGVDLYQLNILGETPLHRAMEAGKIAAPATTAMQARMYAEGVRIMASAHWRRLSASHWGRTTRERNIYNNLVKGPGHCLAFGPGGGGAVHGWSYFLDRNYASWRETVLQGQKPLAGLMAAPESALMDKMLAQEFDTGNVNLPRMGARLNLPLAELAAPVAEQWRQAGLLEADGPWLNLTVAGLFWQVTMAHLLIKYLNHTLKGDVS